MNARTHIFEVSVEGRQVQETVASIFHTLLFHRTLGKTLTTYNTKNGRQMVPSYAAGYFGKQCYFHQKRGHKRFMEEGAICHPFLFHYKQEESYSVGTVGFQDVTCDFVDFTYVRVSSDELASNVSREINSFSDALRSKDGPYSGKISLEFFQKKRSRWLFAAESIPWEVWTLKVNVISLPNEHERQIYREKVGDLLAEKVFTIAAVMNRQDYVPKMPSRSDVDLIFDTSYPDIQPYLFKISHETSGPTNPSVAAAVRKLIKDTLTF